MLLIYPPVAKACEPPAGVAMLAAALAAHDVPCRVLDANLEGQLYLLGRPQAPSDTWTRRAVRNVERNLAALRDPVTYRSLARYRRATADLGRVLSRAGKNAVVGLADFEHRCLSPHKSADLLAAAEHPEDDPFFPYFQERLTKIMEESTRRIVGFSLNFLNQALCAFTMIGFLRREFPEVRIALGGGLVGSWMKRPGWSDPFGGLVDYLIAGPGEGPLLELHGVTGGGTGRHAPDYRGLPRSEYLSPGFILPYSASSGCWWNKCSFCPEPAEGTPYVPVPADEAVGHLHQLVQQTGPALIHLLDNSISPALMSAIVDDPPGVPWYGFARIGQELLDPDFCKALERSGCRMLKLGLESGDQDVLDRMEKGIDLATASTVLKNLRSAGIAAYVYLLFGSPAETEASARSTLRFIVDQADAISFLNLAVFNMPAGAKEAEQYGTGPFSEGDLSLYTDFRHPRGWDRKAVRRFLDGEFRKHPAIAAILKNDPPSFTSNHAPFFAPE
jgi:radical SAM superfamily enzyme YgiQ (UPF0313 family)